jgi:hypothetical protein
VFPYYYFKWPYPSLNSRYDEERWLECKMGQDVCGKISRDAEGKFTLHVRAPRVIADFAEMPLEVRIRNLSSEPQNAVVSVVMTPTVTSRVYIRLDEHEQSSATFESIPLAGEVVATFLVRVAGGQDGDEYPIEVMLNGKQIEQPVALKTTIDRKQVFRLWVIKNLLFPPGASLVIPLSTLLLVSWGETCSFLVARRREIWDRLIHGERSRLKWVGVCVGTVAVLALLFAAAWAIHYLLEDFFYYIALSVLVTAVIGGLVGLAVLVPQGQEHAA